MRQALHRKISREIGVGLKISRLVTAQIVETGRALKDKYNDNFVLLEKPADGKYLEWYAGVMEKVFFLTPCIISAPDRFLLQNQYVTDDGSDMFLFMNAHMSEARETDITFPKSVTAGKTRTAL